MPDRSSGISPSARPPDARDGALSSNGRWLPASGGTANRAFHRVSCPILPGSGLDLAITLGSEARMRLRYEIHDPGYRPRQVREPTGRRGLFHVDPPYAYGDADLGDNTAEIHVALGGTSIGFE